MSEISVRSLIGGIKSLTRSNYSNNILKVIENIDSLIESLEELDELIEMYDLKTVIVQQIKLLLVLARKNSNSSKLDGHKLHAVFYGPPGVGKSLAAVCMASIWKSLGIITELQKSKLNVETKENGRKSSISSPSISVNDITEITSIVNATRSHFLELYEAYKPNLVANTTKGRFHSRTSSIGDGSTWNAYIETWEATKNKLKNVSDKLFNLCKNGGDQKLDENKLSLDQDYICVCGREDLVAGYAGQTAQKTKDFLMKNRGKCIIIEEAYLLCTSSSDNYGLEALTVLNRFMDENSNEAIIIMTGYQDKMNETIFKSQPGLKRRFQWAFEINGYSPEGLSKIFISQLHKEGWKIDPKINLPDFFKSKMSEFEAFGGDTERLVLQCKMLYGEVSFESIFTTATLPDLCITSDILKTAYEKYLINKVKNKT